MSFFKNEYMLGHSNSKSITKIAEAVRIDLCINKSPFINSGTLIGLVRDTMGNPIADAIIIILDTNYANIANTLTDSNGQFVLQIINPGTYKVYSKAPGFELSGGDDYDIKANQTVDMSLTLLPESLKNFSVAVGHVHDIHGIPISSSLIELFRIENDSSRLVGITFSNEVGDFIIGNLEVASYYLKISATGYFTGFFPLETTQLRSIIQVEAELKEDIKASKGVIMGIITNSDDQPVSNADVVLYLIGTNKSPTPVNYTRTNSEGIYLFVNVPQGEYKVNSNRIVIID